MALAIPNVIQDGQDVTGTPHAQNYAAIESHINTEVVHRDGSVAMTGELQLVDGNNAASTAQVAAAISASVPVGTVFPYAGSVAPNSEWLIPTGQAVSRTTYAELFALIGTTYGAGDGVNTFNLPNLKGRTIFGLDAATAPFTALNGSGGSKDAVVVSHAHTMPTHTHPLSGTATSSGDHAHGPTARTHFVVQSTGGGYVSNSAVNAGAAASYGATSVTTTATTGAHTHPLSGTATAVDPGDTNAAGVAATNANLPPYLTLQFIIKVL